jgi:hypothetical protein
VVRAGSSERHIAGTYTVPSLRIEPHTELIVSIRAGDINVNFVEAL